MWRRRRYARPLEPVSGPPSGTPTSDLDRTSGADPRISLVLEQVLRGLSQQQAGLNELRSRAATLVAAAALGTSLLSTSALRINQGWSDRLFVGLALVALGVVVVCAVLILWPREWKWRTDGHKLLVDYVEADPPATINEMRRDLAYFITDDLRENDTKLKNLWLLLEVAIISIAAEVAFWAVVIIF